MRVSSRMNGNVSRTRLSCSSIFASSFSIDSFANASTVGPALSVAVEPPAFRPIENYARVVAQRATRLPAGDAEPDSPAELTSLDADIVILLSQQPIMSFTWPLPRIDPARHLLVIRRARGTERNDPMVSRHVVAHELGHALGLLHNEASDTLMCGPCQPLTAESDEHGFLPLTAAEQATLVALYGPPGR